MLFKKPNIFDKPVEVFRLDDISLLHIHTKNLTKFSLDLCRDCEKVLALLRGRCRVGGYELFEKDLLYIPADVGHMDMECTENAIAYIVQTKASRKFGSYLKRFGEAEKTIIEDAGSRRTRYTLIGEKDESERMLAGYTFCEPGSWGSYPPHRHDDMYEIFIYFDLSPYFGIQTIFDESQESVYIVRDYDAVLVSRGYHPNVSTPMRGMKYLWVMVSKRGSKTHKMEIHPLYAKS
ncbi:MAG: 5-deoxy-glucuronate isomerase [Ignisphaera sp.]